MKELTVFESNGVFVTDSRDVAEMVNKQHKELMRDIRNYEATLTSAKLRSLDFFMGNTYKDAKGEERPCYLITRKGCDMVANKMTGEKGVLFTAAYINRFHEMESQITPRIPQSFSEALRLAADLAEKNQLLLAETEKKDQIIGELKPKADYTDYILSSMGTMTAGQIAADYSLSAKRLNAILHEAGLQHRIGDQWLLYTKYMGLGYTKSETISFNRSDGRPDTKLFTKWTQKGRLKINEILNARGIYANMDIATRAKESA